MTDTLDLGAASEFACAFHKALVARWPEFAPHADFNAFGDLTFEVPRNVAIDALGEEVLIVIADEDLDETLIAFGGGHSHGGAWRTATDPDHQFRGSIKFIEDILAERVIGFSTGQGGGGMGSREWVDSQENANHVRSWQGTYDRGT